MKHTYTFQDWENQMIPATAPCETLLDTFPRPIKYLRYRPAWGKGGKSAEARHATRNKNIYEKNKELFTREILPKIIHMLDAESLFKTGRELMHKQCLSLSGYYPYTLEEKCSWLHYADPLVTKAIAMGATRQDIINCDQWI